MTDIKFPEGIRAFKPKSAPEFVKANIQINKLELLKWLEAQGDMVRLDMLESKSGTYYLRLNEYNKQQ